MSEGIGSDLLHCLLQHVAQGDSTSFQKLHELSAPTLLSHAWHFVRSHEAAEDVVQESFIGIWRNAARFDPSRSQPMTWMTTIVRYRSLDYLRAERSYRQQNRDDCSATEQYDYAPGPEEQVEVSQQILLLTTCLALLADSQRKPIELNFFAGLSHSEVAREMTMPLGTAKTRIRRGCAKLRKQLETHQF